MWFSASLEFLVMLESRKVIDKTLSVVVFEATDFAPGFENALVIGRELSRAYENGAGETVDWQFTKCKTIDELGEILESSREV